MTMPIRYPMLHRLAFLGPLLAALLAGCAGQLKYMDGWYHLDSGEYAEGLRDLEEAARADPQNTRFTVDWLQKREEVTARLLARADAAILAQAPDTAQGIYQTILAYEPGNIRAQAGLDLLTRRAKLPEQLAQAHAALKQGDRPQAQKLLNGILDVAPDWPQAKALQRELAALDARDITGAPTLSNLYKKPVNLEFRDASLKMVFDVLSKSTGINFILDRDVKADQRTTLFLKQSSLEDAVDIIAAANQLDRKILSSNSVLVYPNNPAKAKEYQDLVVKAFYLNGSAAKDTANLIKGILKLKDIYVDDKLNMLVVRDTPEAIALADKLVALYDQPDPEVVLDVAVIEIQRDRLLQLGVSATDSFTFQPLGSINGANPGDAGTAVSNSLDKLLHFNRGNIGVLQTPSVTVQAHQQNGDADLLANPRIRVRNHEKARIHIGDKIPVITSTTSSTGFVAESVQYLDVGIKLDVEPTIYPQDDVAIKVGLEVSTVSDQVKTQSGTVAYQIGSRSADTVLRLHDGETQVLAGLIRKEERHSSAGLPGLTSLPILGRLFSTNSDENSKNEIVLSITPHLVRNLARQEAGAEEFWSGTDATLRAKPLQLRTAGEPAPAKPADVAPAKPGSPAATPASPTPTPAPGAAPSNAALKLGWAGPDKLKVGEEIRLELKLDSTLALRSLPMQIAYDARKLEIVAVEDGGYFDHGSQKGNFSSTVDKPGGRIAIALGGDAAPTPNGGRALVIRARALSAGPTAIEVTGAMPIGGAQAIDRPALPVRHDITVE